MKGDALLVFSDSVALTTTANSSVIDLGEGVGFGGAKVGPGDACDDLNLLVQLEGTAAPTTASVSVALQVSENNTDWTTLVTFPAKTGAQTNAGTRPVDFAPLPKGIKRYLRLAYTVANGPFTAGKIFACLTHSKEIA